MKRYNMIYSEEEKRVISVEDPEGLFIEFSAYQHSVNIQGRQDEALQSKIRELEIQVFDRGESFASAMTTIEELKNERGLNQETLNSQENEIFELSQETPAVQELMQAAESALATFKEGPPGEQSHIFAQFPWLQQMEQSLKLLRESQ